MEFTPMWQYKCRDQFVYAPSQWEMMLQCNVISYRLGTYTKCLLLHLIFFDKPIIDLKFSHEVEMVCLWLDPILGNDLTCLELRLRPDSRNDPITADNVIRSVISHQLMNSLSDWIQQTILALIVTWSWQSCSLLRSVLDQKFHHTNWSFYQQYRW